MRRARRGEHLTLDGYGQHYGENGDPVKRPLVDGDRIIAAIAIGGFIAIGVLCAEGAGWFW